jgi:hypothetical protein
MQLIEAHMDRVRFSVRRRSPRLVAALLVVGAALVGSGVLAVLGTAWTMSGAAPATVAPTIPPPLDCPAPTDDPVLREACGALAPGIAAAPGLFEAYLARRHYHLTQLLPAAFPPSEEPLPRVVRQWHQAGDEADRRLVAQIHRDATREDTEWVVRDPVVGSGRLRFSGKILDDEAVRASMDLWRPTLQQLPDRSEATLESLAEERVVRIEGARRSLFAAPEGDHVVDRAVADVRRYDALRRAAYHVTSERRRIDAAVASASLAAARAEAWRSRRQLLLVGLAAESALALWVGASVAFALWVLRRQSVVVGFDGHGLRVGSRHLPWDDVVDLNWYEGRIHWTTQRGEGGVTGLALTEAEARAFHRVAWALRNRRASRQADDAVEALASLRSLVGRIPPTGR